MIKEKFIQGETKIVLEGGGIITRDIDKHVLIIHRKKYNDWTLPKGHFETADTSLDKTALREVKEETGYDAEIISVADILTYRVKNELRVVLYFVMRTKSTAQPLSSEDKDDVTLEWLPVQEAIKRLSFEQQKELLKNIFKLKPTGMKKSKSSRHQRLDNYIKVSRLEYESRKERIKERMKTAPMQEEVQIIFTSCDGLLKQAEDALKVPDYSLGWQSISAMERLLIETYDWNEIEARKKSLSAESSSSKLSEWRKNAMKELLSSMPSKPGNDSSSGAKKKLCESLMELRSESNMNLPGNCLEKLFHAVPEEPKNDTIDASRLDEARKKLKEALLILHAQFDNTYFKMDTRRENIVRILWVCIVITGIVDVAAPLADYYAVSDDLFPSLSMIFLVQLFGILGAAFSVANFFANKKITGNIPEEISGSNITLIRPIIGAVSGLVIYLFFLSGMVSILKVDRDNNIAMIVFAFISGFSERLVIKVAEATGEKVK
jgi:8-oxo-dGTP pyrophosphatase MutT (NUDIX family)